MADGKVTIDTEVDDKGAKKDINNLGATLKKGLSGVGAVALKGTVAAVTATTTAIAGLTVKSVQAYASYEQLVGGVDTLFKESSEKVQAYADQAYQTAGLSANAYMETVTSFSASLLQSLGEDTELAADYANRAVIDMADNANKMGTSIESIQNAYQGFAKQNYTMLDNLKLGYGGTKSEMERLIADASQLTDIQEKLNISVNEGDLSFGNIVNAISVMQEKLGIAGTTQKEAADTIEGSINSMKASWDNLLVGLASDTADLDSLIDNFVTSLQNVVKNIVPVVEQVISSLPKIIETLLPAILDLIPSLLTALTDIIDIVLGVLTESVPELIPIVLDAVLSIVDTILENLPLVINAAIQIVIALVTGLSEALPELIPAVVQTVVTIVQGLLDNLPMIFEAALQLILGLAQGLLDSIPILIEALPNILVAILNFITESNYAIAEAGIDLFTSLIAALPEIITTILLALPDLIIALVNAFIDAIPEMIDAGEQLVNGLWEGIKKIWGSLTSNVTKLCDGLLDKVKSIFGIHSPSKEFSFIGKMNAEGLSEGFEDEDPMRQIQKNVDSGLDTLQSSIHFDSTKLAKSSIESRANNITMVRVILEGDANRLFRLVRIENENFKNANGGRSALA